VPRRAPPAVRARLAPHATEAPADRGHGPEQVPGLRPGLRGSSDEGACQIAAARGGGATQGAVDGGALWDSGLRAPLGDAVAIGLGGHLFLDGGEVILTVGGLDRGQELGPLPRASPATPEAIPAGAHLGRINIRGDLA
jgi:hypothetical protein